MKAILSAILLAATALATPAWAASDVVTIYAADGLHDGKGSWFETQFDTFTKATGVKVQYIEAGSGGVVERVAKEKSNPQADVLVTLPPFIQRAEAEGLLQTFKPDAASEIDGGSATYQPLVNNYMNFIYNAAVLKQAPKTYADLLEPSFKGKIQYSTPGQAGDGTAVMLQVIHAFGSKDAGFEFLKKLQDNNVGPSASTGKLTALVNKGELHVANGDLQMNMSQMAQNPNIRVFWPAGPNGERSTLALPYYVGLVTGAPDAENGKKLIDFLLSKEAQSTVSSIAIGVPVRKDVTPTDANFAKLHEAMQGVTVWTPDWAAVLKDLPGDVARWRQATGS
ncbi:2-aminoethylphosphonate ABC transporter substrate-binding protein [Lichenihabitans sp. PAMC28606]|uniref:2-aminoethylphosphonate ABC transporter substrate-binding protein n=1 Tax=Lichenihabitans sp. PAMC28606 TaxID=2880932 RepID=UPI001D0B0AF4|nr:2-aminoethylphosphonate ABC transporter substrate-binding protein [Lichenihabitans sp. PAMC28606]UDL94144.1 2-aminoethylphosphonate ABC transporter substrate-binding protein [Lichenihabitans sp. PAMC28606]